MSLPRIVVLVAFFLLPALGCAQSTCTAAPLSDEQIKTIVVNSRATRSDLPAPFPSYKSVVRREGCSYIYMEISLPETPENYYIFRLNQNGVIVDVQTGNKI